MEFNPAISNFEKVTAPRAPSAPSPAQRTGGMEPGPVKGPCLTTPCSGQEMVSVSTDEGNSLTAPGPQQRNFLFGEVPTGKAKRLRKERIKSGDGKRVFHCVHCLEDRLFIRSTVTSSSLLSHYSIM